MAVLYGSIVLWGVIMNPNYNQKITIYNCLRANDNPNGMKDIWHKTVLKDCFYKTVIGRSDTEKNPRMQSTYTVRIPETPMYRPYREWIKLSKEERGAYFTCSLNDIVVKGDCADEITGSSPDTASQLLSRYKPDAFIVTAFSDNTSFICGKHYRLGG